MDTSQCDGNITDIVKISHPNCLFQLLSTQAKV